MGEQDLPLGGADNQSKVCKVDLLVGKPAFLIVINSSIVRKCVIYTKKELILQIIRS